MIFALVQDFAAVLTEMPEAHPRRRVVALLDGAVRRDVHFIDRHPTTLFQCLWNSCRWYDGPGAPVTGQPVLASLPERWRGQKEQDSPGFAWVRTLGPPPVPLGTGQVAVFAGGRCGGVAFSPDGRVLATAGAGVVLWDEATGAEVGRLGGEPAIAVAFAADGRRLVSGHRDRTARVWEVGSGRQLLGLTVPDDSGVEGVAFSPDGRLVNADRDVVVPHSLVVSPSPVGDGHEFRDPVIPCAAGGLGAAAGRLFHNRRA